MENETSQSVSSETIEQNDDGWHKVTYRKQRRNPIEAMSNSSKAGATGSEVLAPEDDTVLKYLEKNAEIDVNVTQDNAIAEKKEKPNVTVAEAAAKIDASDLLQFLSGVTESYEGDEEVQLTMFADYFQRSFSTVTASEFAWVKKFRDSTVEKMANVPISDVPAAVHQTSADWIDHRSIESLGTFVLLSLDTILADLEDQQSVNASSKSQVAIFFVLAMVLRRKPDVLIHLLPRLIEKSMYQGQEKLSLMVWMAVQASQGDHAVGLYLWAHQILPILGGKSRSNPQYRDLVLQLVERIISASNARDILINSAVRKGERLIPRAALDLLLQLTFPVFSSARVKSTERRFEAVFPVVKDVALAGSPGNKGMEPVLHQIQDLLLDLQAAGEGVPELRKRLGIFVLCLTQDPDSDQDLDPHWYRDWDKIYLDNLEASIAILKRLDEEWDRLSYKVLTSLDITMRKFLIKNHIAKDSGASAARKALFDDSNKYCDYLMKRLTEKLSSSGYSCVNTVAFIALLFASGATFISSNRDYYSWDWKNLAVFFNAK